MDFLYNSRNVKQIQILSEVSPFFTQLHNFGDVIEIMFMKITCNIYIFFFLKLFNEQGIYCKIVLKKITKKTRNTYLVSQQKSNC